MNFLKRINKIIFILLLLIAISCHRQTPELKVMTEDDTSYFDRIDRQKVVSPNVDRGWLFYMFFFTTPRKIYLKNNLYIAVYYKNGVEMIYVKKMINQEVRRSVFAFGSIYPKKSPFFYSYVQRICEEQNNKLNAFDSLPYLRLQDSSELKSILTRNISYSIEEFNKMIKFSGRLKKENFRDLVFNVFVSPTYYSPLALLTSEEENEIWQAYLASYYPYYPFLLTDKQDDISWLQSNREFLHNYFQKKVRIDLNTFYIITGPDLMVYKVIYDRRTQEIRSVEYINWQYHWLQPFRFYTIVYFDFYRPLF